MLRMVGALLVFLFCGILWVSGAEKQALLFLGDKDYPPVAYLEDGTAKGMVVDLAKALAAPMKREIRIELMDWDLAQEKVLKGEADGLLGLSVTEERRRLYDFATSTFTREFGLVVRSGKMTIHGVNDLAGKRVGVTPGGFPRKFMEERTELFDTRVFKGKERIPFGLRQEFFTYLLVNAKDFRAGDILAIQGVKRDNRVHQHAILLEYVDPITGFPAGLADQMHLPRRRTWEGIMAEAPRRSLLFRARPLDAIFKPLDDGADRANPTIATVASK